MRDWREQSGAMIFFAVVGFTSALLAVYQANLPGRTAPILEFIRGLLSVDLLRVFCLIAFAISFLGFTRLTLNAGESLDFEKPYDMLNIARSGLASLVFPLVAFLVGILLVDTMLLAKGVKINCDVTRIASNLAYGAGLALFVLPLFYAMLIMVHSACLMPQYGRVWGMVSCLLLCAYYAVDFADNVASATSPAVSAQPKVENAPAGKLSIGRCELIEKGGI